MTWLVSRMRGPLMASEVNAQPPPRLHPHLHPRSQGAMHYGHLYTWHGVKSGNGQRGVQGERLALIPLSSELWEKPFPPHPQFSPKKICLKVGKKRQAHCGEPLSWIITVGLPGTWNSTLVFSDWFVPEALPPPSAALFLPCSAQALSPAP